MSKGEVLLCRRKKDNEYVVLKVKKVLKFGIDGTVKSEGFIKAEHRLNLFEVHFLEKLAKYYHPHIVKLNAVWVVEKFYEVYIEFEQCETNMGSVMKTKKYNFSIREAADFLRQTLLALRYCHLNGIIHADVKEENLLIKDNKIKLCDFDMARQANSSDPRGLIPTQNNMNDFRYQPIELLLQTPLCGYGIDMYAAGCMFIKMFAGERQSTAEALYETFNKQEQLFVIHQHSGPIHEWYFRNGGNPDNLTSPVHYAPKYFKPAVGFQKFFDFLPNHPTLLNLVSRMIECDLNKRIDALSALNHQFFYVVASEESCNN